MNKIINVLNANKHLQNTLEILPLITQLNSEDFKSLINRSYVIVSQYIGIYAKYIINEILSIPEDRSKYKFFNSDVINRRDLSTEFNNIIDNILSGTVNDDLNTKVNNMILFSKEYSPAVIPDNNKLIERLIDNNTHNNIFKYMNIPNILYILKEYTSKKIEDQPNYFLHYYFKHIVFLDNYRRSIPIPLPRPVRLQAGLEGGSSRYYSKYLKYKQKYMELKQLKHKF